MIGKLIDVFEISGRGCVVLIEMESGHAVVGDELTVGQHSWPISGIEIVKYRPEALERIRQGWVPPVGILLRGAEKSCLLPAIGDLVSVIPHSAETSD